MSAAFVQAATSQLNIITNASPGHALSLGQFDGETSALGDFDRDGKMEVVANNDNQDTYVLSGTTSRVLSEIRSDYPAGWPVRTINDPAVADVDGDGIPEIVIVNSAAVVCVYHYASGTSTTSMSFTKKWCHRMDAYMGSSAAADAGAATADVDGAGKMTIFSNTEDKGLFAFNWDGSTRWSSAEFGGNGGPLVTDLHNDGRKQVIFFGDGGEVRVRDAKTGASVWTFWGNKYVWPASIPVAGNAADLDGDGQKEVVFIMRDAHDATNFANDHFVLWVLGSNGQTKWHVQPSWGTPLSYTHPVIVDVDGDGKKEIIGMDWNTIGHKPGNWEVVGSPHVFAYSSTGVLLWKTDVADPWSNDDIAVADVTGDGVLDVLAIGTRNGSPGVWYLNARTGALEQHVNTQRGALRGPVLGDLDGSGKLGWAISIHSPSEGGGFQFFRTDAPCAGPFLSWQGERNCGGAGAPPPPPPPPTPPPSGTFDAIFTSVRGNEWWVQAHVTAVGGTISQVDVSLNGGTWRPLVLQSWGDWASSYHAPQGTIVQLRATSTTSVTDTSACYKWLGASATDCGAGTPPPPSSGSFAATFTNVRGNVWWVESNVAVTGGALVGVDARVNGGVWTALGHTSWGSWAKSIHAAAGATVEFRARSSAGEASQSAAYPWPPT
ncbi:MAG: VCBS repeat-containing protein [Candidatus Thermoplasmatota archaeon]